MFGQAVITYGQTVCTPEQTVDRLGQIVVLLQVLTNDAQLVVALVGHAVTCIGQTVSAGHPVMTSIVAQVVCSCGQAVKTFGHCVITRGQTVSVAVLSTQMVAAVLEQAVGMFGQTVWTWLQMVIIVDVQIVVIDWHLVGVRGHCVWMTGHCVRVSGQMVGIWQAVTLTGPPHWVMTSGQRVGSIGQNVAAPPAPSGQTVNGTSIEQRVGILGHSVSTAGQTVSWIGQFVAVPSGQLVGSPALHLVITAGQMVLSDTHCVTKIGHVVG